MAITAPAYEPGTDTTPALLGKLASFSIRKKKDAYFPPLCLFANHGGESYHRKLSWPDDFSPEAAPILPKYRDRLDMKPPEDRRKRE